MRSGQLRGLQDAWPLLFLRGENDEGRAASRELLGGNSRAMKADQET